MDVRTVLHASAIRVHPRASVATPVLALDVKHLTLC